MAWGIIITALMLTGMIGLVIYDATGDVMQTDDFPLLRYI
jgi:hypothetical protein